MAERYYFFNDGTNPDGSVDERVYSMSDFNDFYKQFLKNGIYRKDGFPTLRVTTDGNSMNTVVDVGSATINGQTYINDEPLTLTHDTADSILSRIDRVVLQLNLNTDKRYIKSIIKKGVPNTNPTAAELVRNDLVYELSLAQVEISPDSTTIEPSEIIDERLKPSVCGIANGETPSPLDFQVITLDDSDNPTEINYLYKGKLFQKVKSSNANAGGFYETIIIDEYIGDDVTVGNTIKCTLTYSDNGTVTSKSWEVI